MFSFVFTSKTIKAQISNNEQDKDSEYGFYEYYYVDQIGLQAVNSFPPLNESINPNEYVIGSYDVISIYGIGLTSFYYRNLLVNSQGDILTPLAGKINVSGKTINEAEEYINLYFQDYLNKTTVYLTLDKPKNITITIQSDIRGTVNKNVVYGSKVSDLILDNIDFFIGENTNNYESAIPIDYITNISTKINIKEESNNKNINNNFIEILSNLYELRNIKIKRNNEIINIDLFAFFNSNDIQFDHKLMNNDVIILQRKVNDTPTISISGAINRPFSNSYKTSDSFKNLLKIANGFHVNADTSYIIRIRELKNKIVSEQMTLSQLELEPVKAHDSYIIPFKSEPDYNFGKVEIIGEIKYPGIYSILSGTTTVYDVLELAGGIKISALQKGAYLVRNSENDSEYYSQNKYDLNQIIRNYDQYLEGLTYMDIEQNIASNSMNINLSDTNALNNILLTNNDILYIPKDTKSVEIVGQVNNPGIYKFVPYSNIDTYLELADGFTETADKERIFIIKAGNRSLIRPTETEIESGDKIFVDRILLNSYNEMKNLEIQELNLESNTRSQNITIYTVLISTISTIASLIILSK